MAEEERLSGVKHTREYLSQSTAVQAETVKARPFRTRLIGDVIGMASPLL